MFGTDRNRIVGYFNKTLSNNDFFQKEIPILSDFPIVEKVSFA